MGSGHSTTKAASAEEQKPETGTTLFGSWDKPVADAYALKQQVSKKGRVVVVKAADAAGAAAGSTFQMEAGAGVKPSGTKATSAKKGPGTERERGLHIFSQPFRLYRCVRVVNNLVKTISTKRLSCLNSLK